MGLITKIRAQVGTPDSKGEAQAPDAATLTSDTTEVAELVDARPDEDIKDLNWFQRRKERKTVEGDFDSHPHLLALKPKERYVFHSDYFDVDDSVACVLAFFHDDAANDGFAPFWGIDRIPAGLDERVTTVVFEQVSKRDEKWIDNYIKQSERLEKLDANEQSETGTTASKRKAAKISSDRDIIIGEIQDGAAYLHIQMRLLVKAPDLETLEDSLERIARLYIDRFGTLKAAPYAGEQRQDLAALLKKNEKKRGKGFHLTSTEYAGAYSLVTNGLNDTRGEYVGYMIGDVNNSAVLLAANDYEHHVVVADGALSGYLGRAQVSDMWCSKLAQSCMLDNGNVVHLVLDGADLDKLGPKFDQLSSRVDLNSGDVNMFEMFGDEDDELTVFAAQMQKLTLMFEQLYESSDGSVASIIRGELEAMATQFYVDQGMWQANAKNQRHRLRIVNIPHTQVPRLQMFVSYLDMAHKRLVNSSKNDPDQLRAYNVLKTVAANMLSTNGDLFNNFTASAVDGVRDAKRVVYDFSRLIRRGKGIAMAQLVNIVGFAIGKLGEGDTVIIHGAEQIDDRVKGYIEQQFEHLFHRGGRVVFSYNDIDKMLEDDKFNKFDVADYTILGSMRDRTVKDYQERLHQQIPRDLANLVTRRGENLSYLRRGVTNVVFHLDLALGINPTREKQRRELAMATAKAAEAKKYEAIMGDDLVPGAHVTGLGPAIHDDSNENANSKPKPLKPKKKSLGKDTKNGRPQSTLSKKRRDRGGAR